MAHELDLSRVKLLIVDDSPINHRIVSLSLRGRFLAIDSAYNGLEAFEKYKKTPYDVILMDAMMPVMNGCESTHVIRLYETEQEMKDKAFIIAMTANDADGDIKRCLETGMDAYIGKPFVAEKFLNMLQEKLDVGRPASGDPA
ncbi:response regulator [Mangrovibacterium sp.]|uniref:response regulator n=1 Tax=Mangrovibacterium sp. TaxID=1961364 RepID=UPI0035667B7C